MTQTGYRRTVICLLAAGLALAALADALSEARQLIAEDRFIEAEAKLYQAVKDPNLAPEANHLWYGSLRERGESERAIRKLEEAATLAQDRADWWLELGEYLFEQGATGDAAGKYLLALTIDPAYADAHSALARLLIHLGRIEEAEAQYREALRVAPGEGRHWADLVDLLLMMGRQMEALQTAQQGLEQAPGSASLNRALGRIYERMGETSRAIAAYEAAVQFGPKDPVAYLDLARACRTKGEARQAQQALRKAIALAPEDPGPKVALAWLLLEDFKLPKPALQQARAARALAPQHLDARVAEAWAMYNLDREAEAEHALTAAASEQPGSPEAMYYLGVIANSRGDAGNAAKWLRQSVAEGAGTPTARRATSLLRELGLAGTAPVPEGTATIAPSTE